MPKGYICGWSRSKDPERPYQTDFWFDSDPQKAAYWKTHEEAETDCELLEKKAIAIDSGEGGRHICSGFQIEKRGPGEFVIFCEAPFIRRPSEGAA